MLRRGNYDVHLCPRRCVTTSFSLNYEPERVSLGLGIEWQETRSESRLPDSILSGAAQAVKFRGL
jgi:hypothetical protein